MVLDIDGNLDRVRDWERDFVPVPPEAFAFRSGFGFGGSEGLDLREENDNPLDLSRVMTFESCTKLGTRACHALEGANDGDRVWSPKESEGDVGPPLLRAPGEGEREGGGGSSEWDKAVWIRSRNETVKGD